MSQSHASLTARLARAGARPCGVVQGLATLAISVAALHAAPPKFPSDQIEFFESKIRPLLANQCYECHSVRAKKLKGGLLLDSRDAALRGGDTGGDVVPGSPEKSLLIDAVSYDNKDTQMPPKRKLSAEQIADLTRWVKLGAPWPNEAPPVQTASSAPKKGFDLQERKRSHWCWEPLRPSHPPMVKDTTWSEQPVDRYILAKLEEKQLRPAPPAEPTTLLRRLSFDLTGLPPRPEEVEAFLAASAANPQKAIEDVVDRFLASPAFGERWARHWMDLVRYAETRGHEFDALVPNAYQYRDYVIRAFNGDVPYNQFVLEHLAGDLLPHPRVNRVTGGNESILGTGFWFLGEEVHSPLDIRQDEADRLDNRLDVMSKTFLGMTVTCARCHDHKFDAISQKDYYALTGFLVSSCYRQAPFEVMEQDKQIATQLDDLRTRERAAVMQATAESMNSGVQHVAETLLAARQALQNETERSAGGAVEALEVIAQRAGVSVNRIRLWVEELKLARESATHPLHVFAKVALEQHGDDSAEFASRLSPILTSWQKQKAAHATLPAPEKVVVDYGKLKPGQWLQDGWIFGRRPAATGDPVFGVNGPDAVVGIVSRGSARRDAAWNAATTDGAERDYGKLGSWARSGNVLRTPELTLQASSLWYLVRGPGRAYAAVNSHVLIGGPLHAALLKEWTDDHGQWHWVEHKLTDYPGHRAHVEFSPVGAAPLEIAMVVQSDAKPALSPPPNGLLEEALDSADVNSPKAMAEALQGVLLHTLSLCSADELSQSPDAAVLADWMLRHRDLFGVSEKPVKALSHFVAEQASLVSRIQPTKYTAPAMLDGDGFNEYVLIRGQTKLPGALAPRRFLEAIAGPEPIKIAAGSGRLELARQMVAESNPFVARVMVNRVWHYLFGRGIVPTVDNFGVLGQPPSHFELLDYLASRFRHEQGWSIKSLIRELVLSRAYQMSSAPQDETAEQADPDNLLLHRMNLKRLEGEEIRDAVLAISGRIIPKIGGPSVPVHLTSFMEGRGRPSRNGPLDGDGRRSLYVAVRRNFLSPMMLAFDTPIPFTAMGRRNVSNVPAQALILMNDPFIVEQTHVWAKRALEVADPKERVRQMYLAAFGRQPGATESEESLAFIAEQARSYGAGENDERAWADLGHVLFNVKNFIYLN